jgi:hypothetical protein
MKSVVVCAGLLLVGSLSAGCGDEAPEAAPQPAPAPASPPLEPPPVAAPGPATASGPPRCVGPGSTADEVRAVAGEPDSIVGGWWYYGRTQFHLGSGTVQDYISGGGVAIC